MSTSGGGGGLNGVAVVEAIAFSRLLCSIWCRTWLRRGLIMQCAAVLYSGSNDNFKEDAKQEKK